MGHGRKSPRKTSKCKEENPIATKKVYKSLQLLQAQTLQKIREEWCLKSSSDPAILGSLDFARDVFEMHQPESPNDSTERDIENAKHQTRKAYAAKLHEAIKDSDVVIEVLDARDPQGYRCEEIEETVINAGKHLVLLLNKIDLLDDQVVVDKWQAFLRQSYPCVAFRAMTGVSRNKRATCDLQAGKATRCSDKFLKSGKKPLGAADLMNLLKNYTRTQSDGGEADKMVKKFRSIVVSVIGMPNVGKSSVINSLCRNSGRVKTGNEPGVTKRLCRIKLTEHIQLIDTPGVVIQWSESDPVAIVKGCAKPRGAASAEGAVDVLRALPHIPSQLMKLYNLEEQVAKGMDTPSILRGIAEKRGLVRRGGLLDLYAAATTILSDWSVGKLKCYALPPCLPAEISLGEACVVKEGPSRELDLDNL